MCTLSYIHNTHTSFVFIICVPFIFHHIYFIVDAEDRLIGENTDGADDGITDDLMLPSSYKSSDKGNPHTALVLVSGLSMIIIIMYIVPVHYTVFCYNVQVKIQVISTCK